MCELCTVVTEFIFKNVGVMVIVAMLFVVWYLVICFCLYWIMGLYLVCRRDS
jgi:hypothetical protein